jgi:hypothetical protein
MLWSPLVANRPNSSILDVKSAKQIQYNFKYDKKIQMAKYKIDKHEFSDDDRYACAPSGRSGRLPGFLRNFLSLTNIEFFLSQKFGQ